MQIKHACSSCTLTFSLQYKNIPQGYVICKNNMGMWQQTQTLHNKMGTCSQTWVVSLEAEYFALNKLFPLKGLILQAMIR